MDWQSILIPSILSAGISYVVSMYNRRLDFKFDYKKYIVDRRKHAYEEVEKAISQLNVYTVVTLENGESADIHSIFHKMDGDRTSRKRFYISTCFCSQ